MGILSFLCVPRMDIVWPMSGRLNPGTDGISSNGFSPSRWPSDWAEFGAAAAAVEVALIASIGIALKGPVFSRTLIDMSTSEPDLEATGRLSLCPTDYLIFHSVIHFCNDGFLILEVIFNVTLLVILEF